jgi:outer membrane protein assembly factor BamA
VRRTFLTALAALWAAAAPAAAQDPAADSLEVASVDFEGAEAFDDDLLATTIVTQPTQCLAVKPLCMLGAGVDRQYLDARALLADAVRLRVFYYQHGFRDAVVTADTARDGKRMRVTFGITEGRPVVVASLEFVGADSIARDVVRELPLAVGAPLSLIAFEAAGDSIEARLKNRSYAQAIALGAYDIPADSPYSAHVRYELVPGARARFGDITVLGAQKVSPAVVQRLLTFRAGDPYSNASILASQRNLFAQELFRHADIRTVQTLPEDTVLPVLVQVTEGDLHRVRFGLGLNNADYVNAEGRWVSRSFLGGARRLELRGRLANMLSEQLDPLPYFEPADDIYGRLSGLLSADFTQPWFFGALNSFSTGVYAERRSLPDFYVRSAVGGYTAFSRAIAAGVSLSLAYRPELTKLETAEGDQVFCTVFVACGTDDIAALSEFNWLSPLAASYVHDRSNSIFSPTRGYVVRLEAEYASGFTGSNFDYRRVIADVTDYHTIRPGWILAARLRPGWAYAPGNGQALGVHPSKRFFGGGPNSVRGFAQYRLGPKLLIVNATEVLAAPDSLGGAGCTPQEINRGTCDVMALAAENPDAFSPRAVGGAVLFEGNVEVRFPIFRDKLRGATFLDFGQVWEDADAVDFGQLAWTPGLGVRYYSAIGPIRIDVGYNGTGGERRTAATTEVCYQPPEPNAPCEEIQDGVVYDRSDLRNTETLRPLAPVFWNPRGSFFDRLQLHFSIGQAF